MQHLTPNATYRATPQPIVDFMVNSVAHLLKTEFNRTFSDSGVHIVDGFVGTGNFIVRIMQEIDEARLSEKYHAELHCNEVTLWQYYMACLGIEHEYRQRTGEDPVFEGICFADTFGTVEERPGLLFMGENMERVARQKATDMFVVIGDPPDNARQVNEMDNNQNRRYPAMDARVQETYAAASGVLSKNALYEPYVRAFRWATDKLGEEGIVALVTNHSFIDGMAFDGMRKHLAEDFDTLHILDLGGNIRRGHPGDSNVLGTLAGVSISFFVKKRDTSAERGRILYHGETEAWSQRRTFDFLHQSEHVGNIPWEEIRPNRRHVWFKAGLHEAFETFIPMGSQMSAEAIFEVDSNGLRTGRDSSRIYNFNQAQLYRGRTAEEPAREMRASLYRPFTRLHLFLAQVRNDSVSEMLSIFPEPVTENRVICVSGGGSNQTFQTLVTDMIPSFELLENTRCFPFYLYDAEGTNRRENITDWALAHFREHYADATITKWDIFHYTYAVLHHPNYRETYQHNLRLDLPHIPLAPDFWGFVKSGAALAECHVNYESQPEYAGLELISTPGVARDWRVERMLFSRDRTSLRYNDSLTVGGIPEAAFSYRLGSRSALEWVVAQYRVRVNERGGVVNDANRVEEPEYIVKLIGRVVTVSLETVRLVESLPALE